MSDTDRSGWQRAPLPLAWAGLLSSRSTEPSRPPERINLCAHFSPPLSTTYSIPDQILPCPCWIALSRMLRVRVEHRVLSHPQEIVPQEAGVEDEQPFGTGASGSGGPGLPGMMTGQVRRGLGRSHAVSAAR